VKPQTVVLINMDILDRVLRLCRRAVESETIYEVLIKEHKVSLSAQQRKLYFFWLAIIGDELGYEKDEIHLEMKKKFLISIYVREHEGFAEMVESLRVVQKENKRAWRILADHVLRETSIMDASVKEMKEYLTDVDRFAASQNIPLPLPADRGLDTRIWRR
jgi:hypothetical protein